MGTADDRGDALDTGGKLVESTAPVEFWAALFLDCIASVQLSVMALDVTASMALLAAALDFMVLVSFPAWVLDLTASVAVAEAIFIFDVRFLWCAEWMPFFFGAFADLLPTT